MEIHLYIIEMGYVHLFLALSCFCSAWSDQRLPGNIIPNFYSLSIATDLEEFSYYGEVTIQVLCKEATDTIILHTNNTNNNILVEGNYISVTLNRKKTDEELFQSIDYDSVNAFLIIRLTQTLSVGKNYFLYIPFKGVLINEMKGYYNQLYYETRKNKRIDNMLSMTDFKYTYARHAFPCFDEPALKAVFSIKLGHREGLTSLSNMPLRKTSKMIKMPGWEWDEYEPTPRMSTYQVTFSVHSLAVKGPVTVGKISYALWSRKQAMGVTNYVLSIVPHLLNDLEVYFDMPYPLPKLDLLVLPNFNSMVQENWGIIPSMEGYFAEDSFNSEYSKLSKYQIMHHLTKELVYQWLGNLVSAQWWDTFWLFESLANYIAEVYNQKLVEEWDRQIPMKLDSWLDWDAKQYSSHIVNQPISKIDLYPPLSSHPEQVEKGMLLMRMLHMTLGDDVFQKGLQVFIKEYAYKTAGPDQFWTILTNQNQLAKGTFRDALRLSNIMMRPTFQYKHWGGLTPARMGYRLNGVTQPKEIPPKSAFIPYNVDIKQITASWINRPGYPVIHVSRLDKGVVKVTQKRFISDPKMLGRPRDCWWIPLTYSTKKNKNFDYTSPRQWLGCKHAETGLTIDTGAGSDDWIIFNNKFSGLYRVNYDDYNWNLITATLNSPDYWKINVLNRVQLANDALSLAWSGNLSYKIAFKLIGYLRYEKSYLQWQTIFNEIRKIDSALVNTPKYTRFQEIMRPIITPIFNSIFQNVILYPMYIKPADLDYELAIFIFSGKYNVDRCVVQINEEFDKWRKDYNDPRVFAYPTNLTNAILCFGLRKGKDADFEFVLKLLQETKDPEKQELYIHMLTCTSDKENIFRLLQLSLDWTSENSIFSPNQGKVLFLKMISTPFGFNPGLQFFYQNFDQLHQVMAGADFPTFVLECIKIFVGQMNSLTETIQMRNFLLSKENFPLQVKALEDLIEGTRQRMPTINWLLYNYETFDAILQDSDDASNIVNQAIISTDVEGKKLPISQEPSLTSV